MRTCRRPTAGSVVLAAILLKMGGYGFLRFSLPMFPIGSEVMTPLVLWMSAIAIVYTSLVALAQEDMKKLIAYSSVAHMGYVTMGIFAANQQGIDGAIFQMLSHGFISGALFLCVGVIYDRMHTREIDAYGGLVNRMPAYALIFMLFTMANVGLPGTSGFIGEFLTLVGIFQVNTWVALVATSGVILSAAYALWLYRRVVMGDLIKESLKSISDMGKRERAIFAPLVVMTLLLGVYPSLVTDIIGPSVEALITNYDTALADGHAASQTAAKCRINRRPEMMQADLNIILPEIVLSVYAMAALLVHGLHRQGQDGGHARLADRGALRRDGVLHRRHGSGTREAFGGMFIDDGFARFAKVTILLSAAAVLGHGPGIHGPTRHFAVRIPAADRACGGGHDGHGQRGRPDGALHGLGVAIAGALCRGVPAPRQCQIDRGRAEILRPRCAQFGPAALWRLADLWLRGHDALLRYHPGGRRPGASGPALWHRLRHLRHGLQGQRRAVPHVDAGCLRRLAHTDHRLLCHRPQDGRDGPFRPRCA